MTGIVGRIAALDWRTRARLAEAIAALGLARLWVLSRPFHAIATRLAESPPGPAANEQSRATALAVGWAVRAVHHHLPFRAMCLEQAVAVTLMLRRRGIGSRLHLGTARDRAATGFLAHAWVNVADATIIGAPIDAYAEIARY